MAETVRRAFDVLYENERLESADVLTRLRVLIAFAWLALDLVVAREGLYRQRAVLVGVYCVLALALFVVSRRVPAVRKHSFLGIALLDAPAMIVAQDVAVRAAAAGSLPPVRLGLLVGFTLATFLMLMVLAQLSMRPSTVWLAALVGVVGESHLLHVANHLRVIGFAIVLFVMVFGAAASMHMVRRVVRTIGRLAELNETLDERVQQRTRELRDAQAKLVQSEKMASLGKLVAGVAHDINTPLGAITSTQQTLDTAIARLHGALEKDHPDALSSRRVSRTFDVLRDTSGTIASGAGRVDEVVTRLRKFARLDEATLQDVDVASTIDDVLALVEHRRSDGVELTSEVADVPKLRCYPAELNQLLLNVLNNALDAVGDEGQVTVHSRHDQDDVEFKITDDGPGIDPEHLDQIFDPGFTTKGVGVGGGFGLSIAYRIADDHGGSLTVDSELGAGTTVTARLPLSGPPSTTPPETG
jgi:signal transduction histidine kinase